MLSGAMSRKLNEQITNEFHAAHVYLAMACAMDELGLKAVPKWFRHHSDEERVHAMKLVDYIVAAGGTVKLDAIPSPGEGWSTMLAAAEAAYAHEQKVTRQIHDLVALADKEKDYATRSFLNWFVDEQVEELDVTRDMVQLVKMAGDDLLKLEAQVRHRLSPE